MPDLDEVEYAEEERLLALFEPGQTETRRVEADAALAVERLLVGVAEEAAERTALLGVGGAHLGREACLDLLPDVGGVEPQAAVGTGDEHDRVVGRRIKDLAHLRRHGHTALVVDLARYLALETRHGGEWDGWRAVGKSGEAIRKAGLESPTFPHFSPRPQTRTNRPIRRAMAAFVGKNHPTHQHCGKPHRPDTNA